MSNIELLIKIPEENYVEISNSNPSYADDFNLYYAIKNGISLPKFHGELKDVDALYNDLIFPNEQWAKSFKDILDDAPTIIKAKNEE